MRAPEGRSSDPRWGKPGAAFREQQRAHLPSRMNAEFQGVLTSLGVEGT